MPLATYPTNLNEIAGGVSQGAYNAAMNQSDAALTNEKLNQIKALQDYLFAEQNNPQLLEKQRLENVGTGFTNRSLGVKADIDEALKGSNISAGLSKNQTQLTTDQLTQTANLASHFGQLADMVKSGVPVLSLVGKIPEPVYNILSQPGGADKLGNLAKNMATHTISQYQEMQKVNAQEAGATARSNYTADKHLEGVKYATDNKKLAGSSGGLDLGSIIMKSPTLEAATAKLQVYREFAQDPETLAKIDTALGNIKALWQAKLNAGMAKPGIDSAETAITGQVVGNKPVQVPGANTDRPDPLGIRK